MSNSLKIFGVVFDNVEGIKAKDENNNTVTYIKLSGGSSVASGTYTPASDETNPTIDPNVDSDMLLFYLSPDSNVNPLGNSKRVTYGGLWSKATNKRVFYMASNASGNSWTTVSVDLSQTQPSGTAYNLNTDYLISGATYQWVAWGDGDSDPETWDWKEDGAHHIWINITVPENLTQKVAIKTQASTTYGEIDWGDGSAVDSMHSSTAQTFTHTYAATGKYEIKITRTAGTGYVQITGGIDDASCISNMRALEYSSAFSSSVRGVPRAVNLKYVNLGKSNHGGNSSFSCTALKEFVAKNATNGTGAYYFQSAINLKSVDLGSTTDIAQCAFESTGIRELTIPATVTNVGNQSFRYTVNLIALHFESNTPPTLANTQAFTGVRSDLKFYVPYSADHSVLDAYKAATNWSTYADRFEEETP